MRDKELLLETRHMSFAYEQGNTILEDINVSICKGERIAVLGANGAGKSTFFLTINGVRIPQEGELFYRGEKIGKKNREVLTRNIGIVFQDADNQIVASTVKAEVAFGPMNQKLTRQEVEVRVMKAMHEMNIADWKDRPPHYLSGGEKKRVTIADILAMTPEIIVFDEPTAALDPLNAEMFEEVIGRLSGEGRTILISTHDVDFAYRFADRVLIFSGGRLAGDGRCCDIFTDEALLKCNHLKKPVVLEAYELLKKKDKLTEDKGYPRTLGELEMML